MKISVDAGALCQTSFSGNYIFSRDLIAAIAKYDRKNQYSLYSFCLKPGWLKETKNVNYQQLTPSKFWMTLRVSAEQLFRRKDLFLALNQALPFHTGCSVIAFSHGLSFHYYPQMYQGLVERLENQLVSMVERAKTIVVSSIKVKKEMQSIFPRVDKIAVIPFGVPFDMQAKSEVKEKGKYFLYVGTDQKIKNLKFLTRAFQTFRQKKEFRDYKLHLVGSEPKVTREKLRKLYQGATAYLTASFYESFNLPVLEALSQDCPVIGLKSAIIPEFAKYVNVADNLEEFISLMEKAVHFQTKKVDVSAVRQQFSWKKYVEKLVALY